MEMIEIRIRLTHTKKQRLIIRLLVNPDPALAWNPSSDHDNQLAPVIVFFLFKTH